MIFSDLRTLLKNSCLHFRHKHRAIVQILRNFVSEMKKWSAYWVLLACLLILPEPEGFAQKPGKHAGYMGVVVDERGDTTYVDDIPPVWVFPKGTRKRKDYRQYYKLVYNFNQVYPYALAAARLEHQVDSTIKARHLTGADERNYITSRQKELLKAFEPHLRRMTTSQGSLLVRLCDREIGKNAYSVIKDYKNGFVAAFWQGVARLFGHNLKSRYDPKGKDVVTEELVRKWEKGEFDALYYSIFFEYPKKPVLPDV